MINKIFYNLSVTLFGILTLTFVISSVLLNLHIPINVCNILIPFIIGIYYMFKNSGNKKEFAIQLIVLLLIIFVSLGISLYFWDDTWDGRSYHTAMIILFKNGWLPLYDNISEITQKLSLYPYNTQFADPYVKFFEIVGGNIYNLTGYIESPKISNLLFLCSLFMYSFYVIENILNKKFISILLSVCICLNSVCISQIFSNYVDLQSYVAFTLFILTVLKIEKSHIQTGSDIFIIIMSSLMLVTVKLTGVIYCPVIYLSWIFYRIIQRKEVKSIIITSVISLVLILITCINPFYTNIKKFNHPFYPMMGQNGYDVEHANYPRKFKNKTPLQRFLISTFAESMNSIEGDRYCDINEDYVIKIPFSRIPYTYLNKFDNPDMRIGGFGYYWSGILCLTVLLFFFLRFDSKEDKRLFLTLLILIALSAALNKYNWWTRFVPQLWLIPVISLIFIFVSKNIKLPKFTYFIAYMCIFFILFNSILIIKEQFLTKYYFSNGNRQLFNQVKKDSVPNGINIMQDMGYNYNLAEETIKPHLQEYKIKFSEVDFDYDKMINEGYYRLQVAPVGEYYFFYKPVSDEGINDD